MRTLCGKSYRSLRSCSLTIATISMTIEMSCDAWPTGLSARTLIGELSTAVSPHWLKRARHVPQRKEAPMRIRVQVIIEADQESAIPPHIEEVTCLERG